MGYIYKITNKINNKCYIGQTKRSINKRWNEHCNRNSSSHGLSNAIKKYSIENFDIQILESIEDNSKLNDLEKEYIKKYNSLSPYGYNLDTGGSLDKIISDESRKIMKEKNRSK